EDQDVGLAGHTAAGSLFTPDVGKQGRIRLQFAVDLHVRLDPFGNLQRFQHLVTVGVTGAPLGGEREQGHSGVYIQKRLAVAGGSNRDLRKSLSVRVGIDGAVRKENDAVFTEAGVFGDHQEE